MLNVLEASLANTSRYATHSSSHITGFTFSKRAHKRMVRSHDAHFFGGFYASAARELNCAAAPALIPG